MFRRVFGFLQRVGSALMLPVAVLPIAGLFLGLGAAKFQVVPPALSALMEQSGGVIFACLPLIFAIAVAMAFAEHDAVCAISAVITYVVMLATMGGMVSVRGLPPTEVLGIASLDTGVFGGILAGASAAFAFNRFHAVNLPTSLAFFAGRRLVPIVSALAALGLGIVLSVLWPVLQGTIEAASRWASVTDPRTAATVYGFVERLLIPFGLHHIWNVPFFFQFGSFTDSAGHVVHGDISRFFAGDRTAGTLGGAFLFKMFGLPGAAFAMARTAHPRHRLKVTGVMASAALTSFLTGITEPIEFGFLFVAPPLYLLHALLAASTQFVANSLDLHLGFTFSQGAIDLLAFNTVSETSKGAGWVLVLGPLYALGYYGIFKAAIERFQLRTPGREDGAPPDVIIPLDAAEPETEALRTQALVRAFGGEQNITGLDACVTRLRIVVKDPRSVDEVRLKALGATAVVVVGDGVQAIFGPNSEAMRSDLQQYLRGSVFGQPAPSAGPSNFAAAATLARIARDHTTLTEDLAQARHREAQLQKNLETGKRLAGLGGVVAGVAHDLRTPITGIKLTLDGLARRRLDDTSSTDVRVCLDELGRLDRLVGQLMVVAKSGSTPRATLELAAMVDERLSFARERAALRGVRLLREGHASLECNPETVTRVVDNLVGNAIEASPDGGLVVVRLEGDTDEARLLIEDEGAGVPSEHEHELFEPFFTLKPQGVGLGLFLSHALVVVQGGRLSYQRRDRHTTFTVGLPLHAPEAARVSNPGR